MTSDRLVLVQSLADEPVVGGREAARGHPQRHLEGTQLRQDVGTEAIDARVLQADRVQHPLIRLRDPWRRVSPPCKRG